MKLKISVHGVAYEVDVEVLDAGDGFPPAPSLRRNGVRERVSAPPERRTPATPPPEAVRGSGSAAEGNSGSITSPIAGTVLEVLCKAGDTVSERQALLAIEAMKMKTTIAAPSAGQVKKVLVAIGDQVREGQELIDLE